MNKFELCVALSELQSSFSIHPNAQTDFDSEAGDLQAARLIEAARRCGVTLTRPMLRGFAIQLEETPQSGSKLVDHLIEKTKSIATVGASNAAALVPLGSITAQQPDENEFAAARKTLARFGVDPDADADTQQKQWRKKFQDMRRGTTRAVQMPVVLEPPSRDEVAAALRARAASRPRDN